MRSTSALLAILLSSFPAAFSQRPAAIENDQVRVLVVNDQPRGKGAMHEHAMNRVMVYLGEGENRLTWADGRVEPIRVKGGEVLWSPAGGKHTSENPGPKALRIVEIELKNRGGSAKLPELDPVKVDPKKYRVEMDNPQVRVVRVIAGPKEKIAMHEHTLNRVVVFLTDIENRITDSEGKINDMRAKAGEVRWGGPAKHREENLSDRPFELIMVELK